MFDSRLVGEQCRFSHERLASAIDFASATCECSRVLVASAASRCTESRLSREDRQARRAGAAVVAWSRRLTAECQVA
jgi:hypothetical protein